MNTGEKKPSNAIQSNNPFRKLLDVNKESSLPVMKYHNANISLAKELLQKDENFKNFYELLKNMDLHLHHSTSDDGIKNIIKDKAIKPSSVTKAQKLTHEGDKKFGPVNESSFFSICFLKKGKTIDDQIAYKLLENTMLNNNILIKISDNEFLGKALFNKKDWIVLGKGIIEKNAYQSDIVFCENISDFKLGISYLLYKNMIDKYMKTLEVEEYNNIISDIPRKKDDKQRSHDDFHEDVYKNIIKTDNFKTHIKGKIESIKGLGYVNYINNAQTKDYSELYELLVHGGIQLDTIKETKYQQNMYDLCFKLFTAESKLCNEQKHNKNVFCKLNKLTRNKENTGFERESSFRADDYHNDNIALAKELLEKHKYFKAFYELFNDMDLCLHHSTNDDGINNIIKNKAINPSHKHDTTNLITELDKKFGPVNESSFFSICFLKKNKEISQKMITELSKGIDDNNVFIRVSESDLVEKAMFNIQDWLLHGRGSQTRQDENDFQKRIVLCHNIADFKLGIAYLLYQQMIEQYTITFIEKDHDTYKKIITKQDGPQIIKNPIYNNIINTTTFEQHIESKIKSIKDSGYVNYIYHNSRNGSTEYELLLHDGIELDTIKKSNDNLYIADSKLLKAEKSQLKPNTRNNYESNMCCII